MLGDAQWLQVLDLKDLPGMNRCHGGCVGHVISSVVVHDLNVLWSRRRPPEADAPLLVDANAVGVGAVALELLQPVARRDSKVSEVVGGIQDQELAEGGALGW